MEIGLLVGKREIYTMYYPRLFCLLLSVTSLLFLLIGLMKPWLLLWWEDVQTRRKVIKVYGLIAVFFYAIYWLMAFIPGA